MHIWGDDARMGYTCNDLVKQSQICLLVSPVMWDVVHIKSFRQGTFTRICWVWACCFPLVEVLHWQKWYISNSCKCNCQLLPSLATCTLLLPSAVILQSPDGKVWYLSGQGWVWGYHELRFPVLTSSNASNASSDNAGVNFIVAFHFNLLSSEAAKILEMTMWPQHSTRSVWSQDENPSSSSQSKAIGVPALQRAFT